MLVQRVDPAACDGAQQEIRIAPGPLMGGEHTLADTPITLGLPPEDPTLLLGVADHPLGVRTGDVDGDGLPDLVALALRASKAAPCCPRPSPGPRPLPRAPRRP